MCAQRYSTSSQTFSDDDPVVLATQLYEMHGYKKAMDTVAYYIENAKEDTQRYEWRLIADQISEIFNKDKTAD